MDDKGNEGIKTLRPYVGTILKDSSQKFQAIKFYDAIAERAAKNGHAIDIWGCALDQVGLHEMKNLIVGTGGYVIQADSFASSLFVQSFKRIWEKDEKEQIDMNFNATVEIKTSREVKVCGMIGAGTSLKANSSSVSENEMGVGGTSQWRLPALNSQTSLAFLLEVVNQVRSSDNLIG